MPGAVSQIVLFADDAVRHGTIDFLNQNHSDLNTKGTPFGFWWILGGGTKEAELGLLCHKAGEKEAELGQLCKKSSLLLPPSPLLCKKSSLN